MTASQTPLLREITAGHSGPAIPKPTLAYFQQRLRNRMFELLLDKFSEQKSKGLTQALLARRIGKTPDVINRWLSSPSNLTLDTLSDLMLGISAEELSPQTVSPTKPLTHNYSHFADLASEELKGAEPQTQSLQMRPTSTARRHGAAAAAFEHDESANKVRRAAGAR